MKHINSEIFSSVPLLQKKQAKTKLGESILKKNTTTAHIYHRKQSHQAQPKLPRGENRLHKSPSIPTLSKSLSPISTSQKFVLQSQSYPSGDLFWARQRTAIPAHIDSSLQKSHVTFCLLGVVHRFMSFLQNLVKSYTQEVKIMKTFPMPIAEVKNISVCHRTTDWCWHNLYLTILETFTGLNFQHNDVIYALKKML